MIPEGPRGKGVKLRGSQGGEEREELAADEADKRTRDWEKKVSRKGEKRGAGNLSRRFSLIADDQRGGKFGDRIICNQRKSAAESPTPGVSLRRALKAPIGAFHGFRLSA